MCGSTYQTRKSHWQEEAVQAFELAEHHLDDRVHHQKGKGHFVWLVG